MSEEFASNLYFFFPVELSTQVPVISVHVMDSVV
jgi:hypothetical protein